MYDIVIEGDARVRARLKRMRAAAPAMLGVALTAGAMPLTNRARQLCPYRTGNLRRSIHFTLVALAGMYAEGKAGSNLVYARIQEEGGTIVPVHAKMLHWVDPDTGEDIFARKVEIPPRPYMRPAADETYMLVGAETARALALQLVRVQ